MGEAQEVQLNILSNGMTQEESATDQDVGMINKTSEIVSGATTRKSRFWWIRLVLYAFFILAGQSAATLLGRLYFAKGGNSNWMATLVQPAGFPILLPLYFFFSENKSLKDDGTENSKPRPAILSTIYIVLGFLIALNCLLYSLGLKNLPVSTYALISASQLAFNALFSFFINKQKFTPFIINSIILLTISSVLLVFHTGSSDGDRQSQSISKGKYLIGFLCTFAASAEVGVMLSVTQFILEKFNKTGSYKMMLDILIYPSLVSTLATIGGLFASGEWKRIGSEMKGYELGQVSYLMTLIWTAICWQIYSVGSLGLIFEMSSLFSNVISILGLPIVPVLAVFFFHDSMNGIKVVSMVLAIWGFISYVYQHYLDDYNSKPETNPAKNQSIP